MNIRFKNVVKAGREQKAYNVDVLETYAYLKGLAIRRRLRFDRNHTRYMVIVSDDRIVIFRNVPDTEDIANILEILSDDRIKHRNLKRLDINFYVDRISVLSKTDIDEIYIISATDFS